MSAMLKRPRKSGRATKETAKGKVSKITGSPSKASQPKKSKLSTPDPSEKENGKSTASASETEEEGVLAPVTPEKTNVPHLFIFKETGFKRIFDLDFGIDVSGRGSFLQKCTGSEALDIWSNKFDSPVVVAESSSTSQDTSSKNKVNDSESAKKKTIEEESNVVDKLVDEDKHSKTDEATSVTKEEIKLDARKERAKEFREKTVGNKFSIRFDISPCLMQDGDEVYIIVFNVSSNSSQFWIYKSNAFAEAFNDLSFADEKKLSPFVIEALRGFKMIQLRQSPNGPNVGKSVISKGSNGGKVYQTRALYTMLKVPSARRSASKDIIDRTVNAIFSMVKSDAFRESYLTMLYDNKMDNLANKIKDPKHDVWSQLNHMTLRVTQDRALSFNLLDEDINDAMEIVTGLTSKSKWSDAQRSAAFEQA